MKHSLRATILGLITIAALALSGCGGGSQVAPMSPPVTTSGASSATSGGAHTMSSANGATIQRPISDFVSAQGSYTPQGAPSALEIGWGSANVNGAPISPVPSNCGGGVNGFMVGLIDYAGVKAKALKAAGIDLHTVVTGTVHQTVNADGTSTINVEVDATNALSYALCWDETAGAYTYTYFGHGVADLISGNGPAALGTTHLSATFNIWGGAGAPLPDLVFVNSTCAFGPPCFVSAKQSGTATGPLHAAFGVAEGTPGTMTLDVVGTGNNNTLSGLAGKSGIHAADYVTLTPSKK